MADLSAWTVTASGRGESEPAVEGTSEEARAANRRVVVTMTPTAGTSAGPAAGSSAGSSARWPDPLGPVGDGPDGVTVTGPDDPGGQVSVTLERITRTGGLLLGCLNVTTGPGGTGNTSTLRAWLRDRASKVLSNPRGEAGASTQGLSDGLTLLTSDNQRLFPADYLSVGSDMHGLLTERTLADSVLNEGATTTICVVWPDTGQDTATLDHQGAKSPKGADSAYAFRLTNIPITQE